MPDEVVTANGLIPARRAVEGLLETAALVVQGLTAVQFRIQEFFRNPERINALMGTENAVGTHLEKSHTSGWRTRVRFITSTTPVLELTCPAEHIAALKVVRAGYPQSPRVPEDAVWIPLIP